MSEALQPYLELPTLPFSILLCLVVGYWLLMILSGIDLDLLDLDFDADIDLDTDTSVLDWGMVGLKWFNLGEVPLMVWMTAFAIPAWLMSAIFDLKLTDPETGDIVTAILRNTGIGLLAAKAVTQPFRGMLKSHEPNTVRQMMGRTCVISTMEATDTFGQAKCHQDGAPLLLTVCTMGETIPQGTEVEIVDYAADERRYIVRATVPDVASASESNITA